MKLIMCVGLPGSGKSTWAKAACKQNPGWIRVNKDSLREMFGAYSKSKEKAVIRARDVLVTTLLQNGYNVIVDDTNLHPKHSIRLMELAELCHAEFLIKRFDTPLSECIKNDLNRPVSVGERVIRRMHQEFIRPNIPRNPVSHLPKAIICDLDGTLSLMNGRNPYDASTSDQDLVNQDVLNVLLKYDAMAYSIIFVSGRSEEFIAQTIKFLEKTNLAFKHLYMRASNDKRKDWLVKKEIYDNYIRDIYDVRLVLDDRQQVVDMWRDQGLTVFQVADGDF